MSKGLNKTHAKYHEPIAKAMREYKDKILRTKEIRDICGAKGIDRRWVFPSDHCLRSENKGMCGLCKERPEVRIFTKIKRGYYKVN